MNQHITDSVYLSVDFSAIRRDGCGVKKYLGQSSALQFHNTYIGLHINLWKVTLCFISFQVTKIRSYKCHHPRCSSENFKLSVYFEKKTRNERYKKLKIRVNSDEKVFQQVFSTDSLLLIFGLIFTNKHGDKHGAYA